MKVERELLERECWRNRRSAEAPLRLGVSSRLLCEDVRFDGGHARDRYVADTLGQWFEFVPVCPELEIGMGAPQPIHFWISS